MKPLVLLIALAARLSAAADAVRNDLGDSLKNVKGSGLRNLGIDTSEETES
jgi:hypothetical protein